MTGRNGSAIVGAIWILAVLSVLIATYAVDAQLQTRVNLYLQERVRVDHLTDAGIAIAEVIMLDYQNVSVPSTSGNGSNGGASKSEIEEFLENDRWYWEKVDLKDNRECSTGAVPVDPLNPDGGSVTVKIKPIESKWNINNLYPQGDSNYAKIWEAVLAASGVPEDYWDGIVDSWCDWRDTDGAKTGDGGAETEFYKEAYEDFIDGRDEDKNKNYLPASRDGEISDLDDLMHLKGMNEYEDEPISAQALLDGGILNPLAKKEDHISVDGFRKYFTVFGSGKVNANIADRDILVTVPGIWQPSSTSSNRSFNDNDVSNANDIADAIIEIRKTGNQREVDSVGRMDDDVGTFKSWSDLQSRVQEAIGGGTYIQQEAEQYLSYTPDKFFEVTITGESLGITHTIKAVAIVEDSKVRYIRWQEDP